MLPLFAAAQLRVAKIFSDNMVLQREQPVHIWGTARPGSSVTIILGAEKHTLTVKNDAAWHGVFKKQKANRQPQSIIINSGNEKIELSNILFGDIWLCAGQSNMQFTMQEEMHYREETANSQQPLLRLYNPSYIGKNVFNQPFTDSMLQRLNANDFYSTVPWQVCDSNTFKTMTAVGYYFGKTILQHENVPIGLINLAIGGCPIETFISTAVLQHNGTFAAKLKGNWLVNDALPLWVKERGYQNVGNAKNINEMEWGPNHGFKPGFAFEAGIQPLLNLPIRGILWYQGESNAQEAARVNEYGQLQKLMMDDYRRQWHQPALPFYWVQLSSIDSVKYKSQLWPQFRDEQRKLLYLEKNGGMAVCSDIGAQNNVHPANKKNVGERLATWALHNTYGHRNSIPSGPLPVKATWHSGKVTVYFQYAGFLLQTEDKKPVRGFSLDGKNECAADIKNNTIIIPAAAKPLFIFYGWKPFTDANLVNAALLPASTFKMIVQ